MNQFPFSKSPLNYDTLLHRFRNYRHNLTSTTNPLSCLLDSIRASRRLRTVHVSDILSNPAISSTPLTVQSLGLTLRNDPSTIENSLWSFLLQDHHYSKFISDPQLVRSFLTINPVPIQTGRVLEVVKDHCLQSESRNIPLDKSLIFIALNLILDQRDYAGAFKLINTTFSSPYYLHTCELHLRRLFIQCGLEILSITTLESLFLPMVPSPIWLICNTIALGTATFIQCVMATKELHRIGWRRHVSVWKKLVHEQEFIAVNKIICHFQEQNEINLLNFHLSETRKPVDLNQYDLANYILELPKDQGATTLDIQELFKSELLARKMYLKELTQELVYLECWNKHGEGFQWVEPDQDPAEIEKLRIR